MQNPGARAFLYRMKAPETELGGPGTADSLRQGMALPRDHRWHLALSWSGRGRVRSPGDQGLPVSPRGHMLNPAATHRALSGDRWQWSPCSPNLARWTEVRYRWGPSFTELQVCFVCSQIFSLSFSEVIWKGIHP